MESFKEWLKKDGWIIENPKGVYEVLRARKPKFQKPVIVYQKVDAKEHLTIWDRDLGLIRRFLLEENVRKVNGKK